MRYNKGPAIKLGQNLAQHHHVLPETFVKHMEPFCQENPTTTFKQVKKMFKKELGKDIFDVFEYFEETPIAVGSIAQVHKAKIIDGPYVAVKVQHPKIVYQTKGDIFVVKLSCNLAEYFFKGVKLQWIYKDFKKNMLQEVDFNKEVENMNRARELFKKEKSIVVPRVIKHLCASRILTMSFEEGKSICDVNYRLKNKIKVSEISNLLNMAFNKQIFEYGFVHADPHQGNLFIRKEIINNRPQLKLVLLDFGLFIELDKEFTKNYSQLWRGIFNQDASMIEDACKALGVTKPKVFTSMVTGRDYKDVMNTDHWGDTEKRLMMKKGKYFILLINDYL